MGENQRGVSGDAEEPRPHGLQGFYGREQELAWLRGLWEQAAGRSSDGSACPPSPRLAVVVADSGLGKTRLVQALYQQLTEDPHWDPAGVDYWPAAFQQAGKSLEVNPSIKGHECHGPPRFLWLGMRGRDPTEHNADSGYTALPGVREVLLAHIATAKRHHGAWATFLDRAGKRIRKEGLGEIAGAAAETVVPFAGLFAKLVKGAASAMEGLGDRIEGVGERIEKQRQDLVEEMLEMLLEVLRRGGAGGRPLPVVLLVDDAQWIDPDALRLIAELWRSVSSGKGLPLLIVCTHWERDWRLLERALRAAGGQLPIGQYSLPELIRRPGGEKWVLDKAGEADLAAYLAAQLPGLTAPQCELVLEKADGNFRTMVENVAELLAEPMHFENDDVRGPLTEPAEKEVRGWELKREHRVAQIFKKLDKRLKESLGWSSRLGVRFLHDVVEEFAALQVSGGAATESDRGGRKGVSASGLDECVDPHAILDVPSAYLRVFRDRAWHVAAEKHFALRSKSTPSLVAELEAVLIRHLIEWVNNSFDEDGNAIWPDAERGIEPPPRSVTALHAEETRDLLAMAHMNLPISKLPDWGDVQAIAALRARFLLVFVDALDGYWERVWLHCHELAGVVWSQVPASVLAINHLVWLASQLETVKAIGGAPPGDGGEPGQGPRDAALGVRKRVIEVARDLVAAAPTPDRIRGLGVSLKQFGDLALSEDDRAGARAAFEESLGIFRELAARLGTPQSLRDLSVSLARVGAILRALGDLVGALGHFEESLRIRRGLVAGEETPYRLRDLSVSLDRVGDILRARGDLAGALGHFEESLRIRRGLVAGEETPYRLRDLSVSQDTVGDILRARGDLAGALVHFEKSLGIRRDLVAGEETPQSLRDLSVSLNQVGAILRARGDLAGALGNFEESLRIRRNLLVKLWTPESWRDLSVSLDRVGDILRARGDLAGALEHFEESLKLRRILVARGGTPYRLRDLSVSLDRVGDIFRARGDLSGALWLFESSLGIRRDLVAEHDEPLPQWVDDYFWSVTTCRDVARQAGDAEACLPHACERLAIAQLQAAGNESPSAIEYLISHVLPSLWCRIELWQGSESREAVEKVLPWAMHLEAAFDDPAIDNAEQQLDATTLERCAEAWALAARCAEEMEQDAARAAQCRGRAAALRDRIAAMEAGGGDGGIS